MAKLLHLLSQIPSQTGSGVFLNNLIRQCAQGGYEQAAIIGLPEKLKNWPLQGVPSEYVREVLFETDRLSYKIPGMSDVMPYESTVFSAMDTVQFQAYRRAFKEAARDMLHRFKPDVVIANHLWVATAGLCEAVEELPENMRPRVYAVSHGTDIRQMQLSPVLRTYVLENCATIDGVFSLNDTQSETIARVYGIAMDRIHRIGVGYDNSLFFMDPVNVVKKNGSTELVYAGKLANAKGVLELVQCMDLLNPDTFRLTLAGSGSGEEKQNILKVIRESNSHIRYVGQLPQEELAKLFRESDIFVLPSYYEGLPLVVIEALASGLKVVVNELNGLRDWLGDAINHSGRILYVPMPKLKGMDTCDPDMAPAYIKSLAAAIKTCSEISQENMIPLDQYRPAIEARSWDNVFKRMEQVFTNQNNNRRYEG